MRLMSIVMIASTLLLAGTAGAQEGFSVPQSAPDAAASDAVVTNRASTEEVAVELVAEHGALPAAGGTLWVALRQEIIPGWHTYYKNPGDSGEPTFLRWDLPEGFVAGDIAWPVPERLPYGPLMNFGFETEAVLLTRLDVPSGLPVGTSVDLNLHAYWLVCEDICIPQDAPLRLTLPVVDGDLPLRAEDAAVIRRAREALPQASPWPARFQVSDGQFTLAVEAPDLADTFGPGLVEDVAFFPDESGVIDNPTPQTLRAGAAGFSLTTKPGFMFTEDGETPPETVTGLLVLTDLSSGETVHRGVVVSASRGTIPPSLVPASSSGGGGQGVTISVGQAVLFAVLGGLILNLMPCVFPILFMKAFGFVAAAREAPMVVRVHGLAFTAGVLVSFAALAGLLLALRAGGAQIGWGFQLQSPLVIGALLYVMLGIGLNLSGVFQVGQSVMGLGGGVGSQGGAGGAFITGILATIVATPCTAPFMAAAIAVALSQPAPLAIGIFLALGFGMALPWLLLSFQPGLLQLLPRPGPWMETVRQVLAFPMYATAAWLLWVLTQQVGPQGLALVLTGALGVGFAGWLFGQTQEPLSTQGAMGSWGLRFVAVLMLVGAGGLVYAAASDRITAGNTQAAQSTSASGHEIVAFDPAVLQSLRDEGRPVFLNLTAAWCITCLVNERVALSQPAVVARFKEAGIVYMKGDWTNRDARITAVLEEFKRSGVPLYVFYPPARDGVAAQPMILPQLLRESLVLDLLKDL